MSTVERDIVLSAANKFYEYKEGGSSAQHFTPQLGEHQRTHISSKC